MTRHGPGLSSWLAIATALLVTSAVLGVALAAIGFLGDLAATEGRARVELAAAGARENLRQSTDDLAASARLLAARPTLDDLLLQNDSTAMTPYLQRYCEAAALDACAIVQGSRLLTRFGPATDWSAVLAAAAEQGQRFLAAGSDHAPPFAGATAEVDGHAATRVVVLDFLDADFARGLGERAGLEIRLDSPKAELAAASAGIATSGGAAAAEQGSVYTASVPVTSLTGAPIAELTARLPTADVVAPVVRATRRLGLIAAVVAVLAAAAGVAIGRFWISGVDRLTVAANRIGAGDLSVPVPTERGRELGILATTMEQTRRKLVELEAARRTRDAVLANISHEFRTPLAAQLASIELLGDGLGRMTLDEQRELVESLERGAKRLTHLIDNLLESVRIESGQLALRQQDIVPDEILEAARDLVEPLVRQRGQRIETDLAAPMPPFRGDRQRLTQVLVNLIANASKFGPPDSAIAVGGRPADDGGIELWVEDSGPGPADADEGVLFEPFRRAGAGDPAESGLGLGLHIVRSIVERHGGTVSLTRTPGARTRATIRLPRGAPA